jgi:hypothetical protein
VSAIAALLLAATTLGTERGLAEAKLGSKPVRIEYGRPRLYGRSLGDLLAQLPEDRVWRAGFNDVTTLTSEGALSLGGSRVPPGRYSLYVHIPTQGAAELILNRDPGLELGKLGHALGFPVSAEDSHRLWPHLEGYETGNPGKGLPAIAAEEQARAPLRSLVALPALDQFTITLAPSGAQVLLTLAWGDTRWSTELRSADADGTVRQKGEERR